MEQTLTRSDGTRADLVLTYGLSDQSGGNTSGLNTEDKM
jgi:hypothetical protein